MASLLPAYYYLAGAKTVPLPTLALEKLPEDRIVILYCGARKRSSTAAQKLKQAGRSNVAIIDGVIVGWKSHGLPTGGDHGSPPLT